MKRRPGTIQVFSLSALDLLAMATGTFVLLVVILMPYYRKVHDAAAEMEGISAAVARAHAVAEGLATDSAAGKAALAELSARARALAQATEEARAKTQALAGELDRRIAAERAARPAPQPAPPRVETPIESALDLVFVIDASGSMGEVIRDLGQSLTGVVRVLERLVPSLRVGFVAYRDYDVGSWVVRSLPLTPTADRLSEVVAFASSLDVATVGGGTVTEAMAAGLRRGLELDFRPSRRALLIVIGDAAAHPGEQAATLALAQGFRASGALRSVSALFVTTPSYLRFGRGDREFFRDLARAGGGTFSDHQGEILESVLLSLLPG